MCNIERDYLGPHLRPAKRDIQGVLRSVALSEITGKVVDFGCECGYHTFGLLWALDAIECVGVDKSGKAIVQARSYFDDLRKRVKKCKLYDQEQWDRLPDILKNDLFPKFVQADVTLQTELTPGFALAYCERVLCHILSDGQKNDGARSVIGLRSAIAEMARVVKPGGYVLAVEPGIECHEYLFEQAGLVLNSKTHPICEVVRYLYSKPSH